MKTSFGSAALVGLALSSAMAFYAVSLHVAAERAGIDKVRAQIVADSHDIRMLQAELRTRARLPELQRWNEQVLALAPPKPNQFVDSPLVLANYTLPSNAINRATTPAVRLAAAHPVTNSASLVQQVAFRQPLAAETNLAARDGHAVPTKKIAPTPSKATSTGETLEAAVKLSGHHAAKPLIIAAAETTPPGIGLDATLGGQLAAAAAQEHATRVSYTLR